MANRWGSPAWWVPAQQVREDGFNSPDELGKSLSCCFYHAKVTQVKSEESGAGMCSVFRGGQEICATGCRACSSYMFLFVNT